MDVWQPVTLIDLLSALLAVLEGAKLHAYPDSGGVWTIGIGHTQGVTPGMVITPAQQAGFLAADMAPLLKAIEGRPILEAVAYGSFGFNCGLGALLKVLNGADTMANPKHTTDAKGNVLSGLVNRRILEEVLIALSRQLNDTIVTPPPIT